MVDAHDVVDQLQKMSKEAQNNELMYFTRFSLKT